jgi:uncharacterized repeat protein (TIGR03803 family)
MTPSGSFKTLWNFNNPNAIHPCDHEINGALLKDAEGNFYGATKGGGRGDWGTVFKLTLHNSGSTTRPPLTSPATAPPPPATTNSTSQIVPRTSVVTEPSIPAAQDEQSLSKSEVTPQSIAEAFVQAYSGTDVGALAGLYADRVDHTDSGVISNAAVRAQAREYFARWPVRHWSLVGPAKTISLGATRQKVVFSASYDASNPQTNKHASGIAQETLILASDTRGVIKIVSQKEQTSKRSNGQSSDSGKKTSEDANFAAAKTEYDTSSHDETTRVRYVTKLADIYYQFLQSVWAGEKRELEGGDLIFEELAKHPAPTNSDSEKLSQLLVGEWSAERHGNPYTFRADGKWGKTRPQAPH